jgi:predicted Zn-dependent protease
MGRKETKIQQLARLVWISVLFSWLSACSTNPVTGESELHFVSTEQEIKMGEQAYFPMRQAQGGDYTVHESVTRYVQQVNNRLAAVSDRDLPFEIVVLNSSVPNAWAMPGGKMAINRGLLTQLNSEAELAAVLGHEIVHSAARHSAKSQERNMLLQGGLIAAQIASAGSDYSNLIAGGAVLGSQLVTTKYGRDAELESDLYGMEYMVRAGYNPNAAIDLQQTFVRLSEARQSGWVEGLFASHPPSQERVARNRETAARLGGDNLEYGRERFSAAIAPLLKDASAYEAQDNALKAAKAGDMKAANASIEKAIRLQPREPKFYGLKGDLALHQKQFRTALVQYDKAIRLDSNYFAYYLQKGYAKKALGDISGATKALEKSNQLLPTPNAQKTLGDLALRQGDRQRALQFYSSASTSRSEVGQEAMVSMVRLELEEKPAKYLKTRMGLDNQGRVVIVIYNQSPVPVRNVEVTIAYFDNRGQQISPPKRLRLRGKLSPGENGTITTRLTDGKGLRSAVSKAKIST